jgi:hypothetical protein
MSETGIRIVATDERDSDLAKRLESVVGHVISAGAASLMLNRRRERIIRPTQPRWTALHLLIGWGWMP